LRNDTLQGVDKLTVYKLRSILCTEASTSQVMNYLISKGHRNMCILQIIQRHLNCTVFWGAGGGLLIQSWNLYMKWN